MKELPNFADLMLLPRVIDPTCLVRVEEHLIHIYSVQRSDEICEALTLFPNVHVERLGPEHLLILPVALSYRLVSVSWPDGRRLGAAIYPENWISPLPADHLSALIAAGLPVQTVSADADEPFEQALKRTA